MGSGTRQLSAYLHHLRHAGNRHSVHSPFVFGLVEQALRKQSGAPKFPDIETLRKSLLNNGRSIPVEDHGAGSHRHHGAERRIKDIARSALKPRPQAELLHRIVRWAKPENMLELGTSLGLTTIYLARGNASGRVTTIEGAPAIHALAKQHFALLGQGNITALCGSFKEHLPAALASMDRLDLAFIDGHHAQEPTLAYFGQCLSKAHNDTVFVLDDIHWSAGMEAAWRAMQEHPRVTVTVDLFKFGLVFLRKEQQREHFRLRY